MTGSEKSKLRRFRKPDLILSDLHQDIIMASNFENGFIWNLVIDENGFNVSVIYFDIVIDINGCFPAGNKTL